MSSFSRNSRRANSRQRRRAIGAGLALALAGGAALAGEHRFVFTAYADAAGGPEVLAGRYRAALAELSSRTDTTMELDPSALDTNRCVAYAMTLQWRAARAACDAAVREARAGIFGGSGWTAMSNDESLALAYANRAVMRWLSHDEAAAATDLSRAHGLAPRADFVARNLAAMRTHVPVARLAASASGS